jgi:hypothetical protein
LNFTVTKHGFPEIPDADASVGETGKNLKTIESNKI